MLPWKSAVSLFELAPLGLKSSLAMSHKACSKASRAVLSMPFLSQTLQFEKILGYLLFLGKARVSTTGEVINLYMWECFTLCFVVIHIYKQNLTLRFYLSFISLFASKNLHYTLLRGYFAILEL